MIKIYLSNHALDNLYEKTRFFLKTHFLLIEYFESTQFLSWNTTLNIKIIAIYKTWLPLYREELHTKYLLLIEITNVLHFELFSFWNLWTFFDETLKFKTQTIFIKF